MAAIPLDETHDPRRQSWVSTANGHAEFPIQNLPFGVFSPNGGAPRGGIAIGDSILDLAAALAAGLFSGETASAASAASGATLNPLMALGTGPRAALRKRFPSAVELVYDNYNALAIGFGPNERTSEAIVSLAIYARGVNLYFIQGARLADPRGVLQGNGTQGRFIRLQDVAQFDQPAVLALLAAAEKFGKNAVPAAGKGYVVIKSVSVKQRPRRSA